MATKSAVADVDLVSLLRCIRAFHNLEKDAFAALVETFKAEEQADFEPNGVLIENTRFSTFPFMVLKGTVEVVVPPAEPNPDEAGSGVSASFTMSSKPVVLATMTPGDISGFMSLLRHRLNSRSSIRLQAGSIGAVVLKLVPQKFQTMLENHPVIGSVLLKTLTKHEYNSNCLFANYNPQFDVGDSKEQPRAPNTYKVFRVSLFSSKSYTRTAFLKALEKFNATHDRTLSIRFIESALDEKTVGLAGGADAVCVFVNDKVTAKVIYLLRQMNIKVLVLRCAGFNNVDLGACDAVGLTVARVPAYSPYAVAEHAVAMIQTVNRKTHLAFQKVRHGDFSLSGLVGTDLFGKTVGVVGTGKIGKIFAHIMRHGFRCRVLAFDVYKDDAWAKENGIEYVEQKELFSTADVISLHAPLLPSTEHMINEETLQQMKDGVILVNTSRGGLIDTPALIKYILSGKIGAAALDVYEKESGLFFNDWQGKVISDDALARLMSLPNVLLTSHQAFLTHEALDNIATTTLENLLEYIEGKRLADLTNSVNKAQADTQPKP